MSEEKLKIEIAELQLVLSNKKHELFHLRLSEMIGKTYQDMSQMGVSNVKFEILSDNKSLEWNISYTHYTDMYDENAYINSSDSEAETTPAQKTTYINFGKGKKYYIRGNGNNRFKIYKNSKNDLRIINTDYDIELDLEDQEELIKRYSENKHIPEWLAIKAFSYLSENTWSDEHIINYLSLV
jgi:hypothetical protein